MKKRDYPKFGDEDFWSFSERSAERFQRFFDRYTSEEIETIGFWNIIAELEKNTLQMNPQKEYPVVLVFGHRHPSAFELVRAIRFLEAEYFFEDSFGIRPREKSADKKTSRYNRPIHGHRTPTQWKEILLDWKTQNPNMDFVPADELHNFAGPEGYEEKIEIGQYVAKLFTSRASENESQIKFYRQLGIIPDPLANIPKSHLNPYTNAQWLRVLKAWRAKPGNETREIPGQAMMEYDFGDGRGPRKMALGDHQTRVTKPGSKWPMTMAERWEWDSVATPGLARELPAIEHKK